MAATGQISRAAFLIHPNLPSVPAVACLDEDIVAEAMWVWLKAGAWCAPSGSPFVPRSTLVELGGRPRIIADLLRVGLLWDADEATVEMGHGDHFEPLWFFDRGLRKNIPDAVRALIYRRDGYQCVECHALTTLTLDHVWPWSLGGSDDPSNLRTLCQSCNSRKGARV